MIRSTILDEAKAELCIREKSCLVIVLAGQVLPCFGLVFLPIQSYCTEKTAVISGDKGWVGKKIDHREYHRHPWNTWKHFFYRLLKSN